MRNISSIHKAGNPQQNLFRAAMDGNQDSRQIAETFRAFADTGPRIVGLNGVAHGRAVGALGHWPELRPLLRDVCLQVRDGLPSTFQVLDKNNIAIAPDLFAAPAVAAFHLRHGLEIAVWYRLLGNNVDIGARISCAVAACHTAFSYHDLMIAAEKTAAEEDFPDWTKALHQTLRSAVAAGKTSAQMVAIIANWVPELLVYQGLRYDALLLTEAALKHAYAVAAAVLPFSAPCERLLTLGGDTRMEVREDTVLNQYGCSPRPRPWAITFASCTATSISDIAYLEAERARQLLLAQAAANSLESCVARETQQVRTDLYELLGVSACPGTEIVLTSSGTDAEYYALHFALGDRSKKLVNILVAPSEVGSGTAAAAAGLHFDRASPFDAKVQRGSPIEGWSAGMVEVERLDIRDSAGFVIPMEAIDASVHQLVDNSLAAGHHVLIHLVDSSKTGLHMPSLDLLRKLRARHPESVQVMVDAAQMRLGRAAILEYLEAGFMVLITGSKFFTGAPFSGALLVPPRLAARVNALPPFPRGLSHYSSRYDFPPTWSHLTAALSLRPNIGLFLRWRAALWEMQAFYCVPPANQFNTIRAFGQAVQKRIAEERNLELIAAPGHDRTGRGIATQWDELATIFTFLVKKPSPQYTAAAPLDFDQAWAAHGWLNSDISRRLPPEASPQERVVAAKRCHIGQPVRVYQSQGRWIAALRIAAGARLVSGVEFDPLLGATQEERLAAEIRDALTIFDKLSLIIRYWDNLNFAKPH